MAGSSVWLVWLFIITIKSDRSDLLLLRHFKKKYCLIYNIYYRFFAVGTEIRIWLERSTAALRIAGSIPARNKYLYGLTIVVPGLDVCVCDLSMIKYAPAVPELSGIINYYQVAQCFFFFKRNPQQHNM